MEPIQIQAYTAKDEAALISMTTRVEAYKVLMTLPRANMLVARYHNRAVGYAACSGGSAKAFVYVYVHPACDHLPVGHFLYQAIEEQCRQKGVRQVHAFAHKESFTEDEHFDYTFEYVRMEYQKRKKDSFVCRLPEHAAIRRYQDADFDGCSRIFSSIGYEQNDPCKDDFFVLDVQQSVAGCGRMRGNRIDLVAVDPAKSGCGCGQALLAYMTNLILKKGHSRAFLWCETKNEKARAFYEKNGYQPCYTACWPVKNLL